MIGCALLLLMHEASNDAALVEREKSSPAFRNTWDVKKNSHILYFF
jgi:hypothetical protein